MSRPTNPFKRFSFTALDPTQPAPQPKTHCKRGHELTPENYRPTVTGSFRCHKCSLAAAMKYKREKLGQKPRGSAAHCKYGHPWTEDNTYRPPGGTSRQCLRCIAEKNHRRNPNPEPGKARRTELLVEASRRRAATSMPRNTETLWERYLAQNPTRKRKAYCAAGHPRIKENLVLRWQVNGLLSASCRICNNLAFVRRRAQKKFGTDLFSLVLEVRQERIALLPEKEQERIRIQEALARKQPRA